MYCFAGSYQGSSIHASYVSPTILKDDLEHLCLEVKRRISRTQLSYRCQIPPSKLICRFLQARHGVVCCSYRVKDTRRISASATSICRTPSAEDQSLNVVKSV